MIRPALLTLLLAAGTPACVAAGDPGAPTCEPEGPQIELNACAADELVAADADLNTTWREVLARQGDDALAVQRLKAAQRLWIELRDADLAAQFPLADGQDPRMQYGSIYPMSWAYAKSSLTRERTRYLRAQFLERESGH